MFCRLRRTQTHLLTITLARATTAARSPSSLADGANKALHCAFPTFLSCTRLAGPRSSLSRGACVYPESPTGLYWSMRGEIACQPHAPDPSDPRWDIEGWEPCVPAHSNQPPMY